MEWISSFVKQGQDQTRLGFNLSFVSAATTNASISRGDGSKGGGFVEVRRMEGIQQNITYVDLACYIALVHLWLYYRGRIFWECHTSKKKIILGFGNV